MGTRRRVRDYAPGDAAGILDRCTSADFDGHTAFLSFTPEQRLDALGQMIAMVVEFKGKATPSRVTRSVAGPQL